MCDATLNEIRQKHANINKNSQNIPVPGGFSENKATMCLDTLQLIEERLNELNKHFDSVLGSLMYEEKLVDAINPVLGSGVLLPLFFRDVNNFCVQINERIDLLFNKLDRIPMGDK